jgi:hypothetical protein
MHCSSSCHYLGVDLCQTHWITYKVEDRSLGGGLEDSRRVRKRFEADIMLKRRDGWLRHRESSTELGIPRRTLTAAAKATVDRCCFSRVVKGSLVCGVVDAPGTRAFHAGSLRWRRSYRCECSIVW